MKEISELQIPDNFRYSDDHFWARAEGDKVRIGITDYAQDQLGDIVYVELPEIGDTFDKNQDFGVVESVKSVSDLLMPMSGEVVEINTSLKNSPNLVNESPYGEGWIIVISPDNTSEMRYLMTARAYLEMLKGID